MQAWMPLLCTLAVSGCLGAAQTPSTGVLEENRAPAPAVIPPAVLAESPVTNLIGPHDELFFTQPGLRAMNVRATEPWTITAFEEAGRRSDPIFLLVQPAAPGAPGPCAEAPAAYRWHSFVSGEGNVLGHAFNEGDYLILLYAERLENLSLLLGGDTPRTVRSVPAYAPPIGLQVLTARPETQSVAFPFRAGFGQRVDTNQSMVFLSEFRVRSNAHSGGETLSVSIQSATGAACAKQSESRTGLRGITGFSVQLAAAIGPGDYQWSGKFEANASANPRFDATGFALRPA